MTILTCDCGYEIYIMDETEATAWQCDRCGQWYDFFGVKVTPHRESCGAVCSQIAFVPLCGIA